MDLCFVYCSDDSGHEWGKYEKKKLEKYGNALIANDEDFKAAFVLKLSEIPTNS